MSLLIRVPDQYEPLRKNRFLLRAPADLGVAEWWVRSASRPSLDINNVEVPFMNTSNFVSGRYKWDTISITFIDPIGPSACQAIMEWVRLHVESVNGRMGYAVGYKRDLVLEMLDPTGAAVSQWVLKSCNITNFKGGELSYDNDELATIDLTVQPFYCILSY